MVTPHRSFASPAAKFTGRFFQPWLNLSVLCALFLATPVPFIGSESANYFPGAKDKWRYLKSPHFEVYTRNSERESRDLLFNLELLRAVFLDRLKLQERLHVDVTVFYFASKRDFDAYTEERMRGQDQLAGFHLFLPDRAVISMAPARDSASARQTIFHEYVHHLFRIAERNPTLWYNEGTAEVFAAIDMIRGRVQLGAPQEERTIFLRQEHLLPLDQLFRAEHSSKLYQDETHTGIFYAESWALLHYWRFGESGLSREAVEKFLAVAGDRETAERTDLRKHFQACFGVDYPEMERRLSAYIRNGSYRGGSYEMPSVPPAASYAMRDVPQDEISARLAELSVRVTHSPIGKLALINATTERPTDPRPFETLGTEAYLERDEALARERWEKALAAGSTNPAILRELALMEGRHWFESFNLGLQLPQATVDRMRSRLLESIEREPLQAAAYEMLAWVESFAERPDAKNINRVIAQLPSMADKKRTLIGLTMIMLRVGKADTAATLLKHLDTLRLDQREAHAMGELRERLTAQFPNAAAAVEPDNTAHTTIAPAPSTPGLKAPSVALPDDL